MKVLVVGLGYVGISVAASLANAGNEVVGVDIDARRVEAVNAGKSPLLTREELDNLLADVVTSGALRATESYDDCGDADAVIVCVDTPVDPNSKRPDHSALRAALTDVAQRMRKGVLVAVESTLAPGTMEGLVRPVLEEGSNLKVHDEFHLVHCPERVTAGRLLYNLVNLDRVVGGEREESIRLALELYLQICRGTLHETSWINAELSKTVENAYRDVQLAFANEVALICEDVGGDVLDVRGLVNSCPERDMLLPGPGVGGHCLVKDPWLLLSPLDGGGELLKAAREVNDGMFDHVAETVRRALEGAGKPLDENRILILGAAYKENIAEVKNSPGLKIYRALVGMHVEVRVHDPHVADLSDVDLWTDLKGAAEGVDCIVLVTPHDDYRQVDWSALGDVMERRIIVDTRGFIPQESAEAAGFRYYGLGRIVPA